MLTRQRTEDGFGFRDLNGNGQLDPYEDSRLLVETRVGVLPIAVAPSAWGHLAAGIQPLPFPPRR